MKFYKNKLYMFLAFSSTITQASSDEVKQSPPPSPRSRSNSGSFFINHMQKVVDEKNKSRTNSFSGSPTGFATPSNRKRSLSSLSNPLNTSDSQDLENLFKKTNSLQALSTATKSEIDDLNNPDNSRFNELSFTPTSHCASSQKSFSFRNNYDSRGDIIENLPTSNVFSDRDSEYQSALEDNGHRNSIASSNDIKPKKQRLAYLLESSLEDDLPEQENTARKRSQTLFEHNTPKEISTRKRSASDSQYYIAPEKKRIIIDPAFKITLLTLQEKQINKQIEQANKKLNEDYFKKRQEQNRFYQNVIAGLMVVTVPTAYVLSTRAQPQSRFFDGGAGASAAATLIQSLIAPVSCLLIGSYAWWEVKRTINSEERSHWRHVVAETKRTTDQIKKDHKRAFDDIVNDYTKQIQQLKKENNTKIKEISNEFYNRQTYLIQELENVEKNIESAQNSLAQAIPSIQESVQCNNALKETLKSIMPIIEKIHTKTKKIVEKEKSHFDAAIYKKNTILKSLILKKSLTRKLENIKIPDEQESSEIDDQQQQNTAIKSGQTKNNNLLIGDDSDDEEKENDNQNQGSLTAPVTTSSSISTAVSQAVQNNSKNKPKQFRPFKLMAKFFGGQNN